jgi:nucleoside-diphosphate-sugar epimerase
VRILDNLSTGAERNIAGLDGVDLVVGDIRDASKVASATRGIEVIFHLAALPSVARSWENPMQSLSVNALGTEILMEQASAAGSPGVVYSSSSSVYGDQAAESKSEDLTPNPISPYGMAKLLGEKLALARARRGGMRVIALRYFNVFGPRQDPTSPYAAVIPLFISHALAGSTATIDGDGRQSRDFTYVSNVVDANLLAARSQATGVAVNVACGEKHTLLELVEVISRLSGEPLRFQHGPPRPGDIKHSLADLAQAQSQLGYSPQVGFEEGLRMTFADIRNAVHSSSARLLAADKDP